MSAAAAATSAAEFDRIERRSFPLSGADRARVLFFIAAGLSLLMSVSLFFSGSREQGIFVGLWVPSILSGGNLLIGREGR